ncbi:HAMP domain-containing histidine kinase [Nocardioides sp. cx-169]|uniref:sensor histidine kinase n=1 Tax=Nocardioides sp. cx-169 TaxID=2899080 RepID=UPI001E61D6EB|nr:HAMP domain-containing sensor histidine kinase [Nocardioides sp. cx-169]MCD4536518.1 HAMP domain-containing histidine kinase [Nocardioides sp. cx-169]
MKDNRVPRTQSLFFRVFVIGAAIAAVAVVAATWATVRSTTVAVGEERQQSLHAEATTYDRLIGYAATHRSWGGAQGLVNQLASSAGHTITVTDPRGHVLLVSAGGSKEVQSPGRARAGLDALSIDTALLASAGGKSTVPSTDTAECQYDCRAYTVASDAAIDARAVGPFGGPPSRAVWGNLQQRVNTCLKQAGLGPVLALGEDFSAIVSYSEGHRAVTSCLDQSRRAVLAPYVAPSALLFIGGGDPTADLGWDLSSDSRLRIALLAGAVLVATLLLCMLLAGYVVRPLRQMAAAALQAGDGDLAVRVPVTRSDEVGQVARAFNTMADRRQQLESARQQLVSDVSHELRTPISNIRGWLEATQDGLAKPDPALVASLLEETLHLQRLVDDLHDLSLGDAGELSLEREEIDLPAFLEQLAEAFGAAGSSAGVEVRVEAAPGSVMLADPVRLRQAVGNLVANALRHTPAGGVVTLAAGPGQITVTDTGEGIAAPDLATVFDRFRRADPSRSRATGGSGLGLAIVRQLVEAHGGTVTLTSKVGVGTVATIRI